MKIFAWLLLGIEWGLSMAILGVFFVSFGVFVWFPSFVFRKIDEAFMWAHRVTAKKK